GAVRASAAPTSAENAPAYTRPRRRLSRRGEAISERQGTRATSAVTRRASGPIAARLRFITAIISGLIDASIGSRPKAATSTRTTISVSTVWSTTIATSRPGTISSGFHQARRRCAPKGRSGSRPERGALAEPGAAAGRGAVSAATGAPDGSAADGAAADGTRPAGSRGGGEEVFVVVMEPPSPPPRRRGSAASSAPRPTIVEPSGTDRDL